MSDRFVLLDRDGVINRDLPQSVCSIKDFELLPNSTMAIAALCGLGYRVIVITNQACVGRGHLTLEELRHIHGRLGDEVAGVGGYITDIFVCPHTDVDECSCRKPKPGLILAAADKYAIDLPATWFVGDTLRDVEAALAAGCRPALVRSGKRFESPGTMSVPIFQDLNAFAAALATVDSG